MGTLGFGERAPQRKDLSHMRTHAILMRTDYYHSIVAFNCASKVKMSEMFSQMGLVQRGMELGNSRPLLFPLREVVMLDAEERPM
jgi:hypothetical protein